MTMENYHIYEFERLKLIAEFDAKTQAKAKRIVNERSKGRARFSSFTWYSEREGVVCYRDSGNRTWLVYIDRGNRLM